MPIRTVILILLAGTALCTAEEPKKKRKSPPLFGAHYYPWYFPQKWTLEPVCDHASVGSLRQR